jgi:ATP-binding cassette subfamily C protein
MRRLRRGMIDIGVISLVISVLLLTQPLYMLQIYDRVLPSSSLNTLAFLSLITFVTIAVLGLLEVFRQLYASRMALRLESELGAEAFLAGARGKNAENGDTQPLRDLAMVRNFVASRVLQSLFDLPFVPLFLLILAFIHPYLFALTVAGVLLIALVAWANQKGVKDPGEQTAKSAMQAMAAAQAFTRGAETIRAMGMMRNTVGIWGKAEAESLKAFDETTTVNAWYGGLSRSIRILLQIAILGVGAWLVVDGQMTAGMIFASSMISGRALQPIDQLVAGWRQIFDARESWTRLKCALSVVEGDAFAKTDLPVPVGDIQVENLIYVPSGRKASDPVIKRLNFRIPAGASVGLVGASGAGKSTLAKLICGAVEPTQGLVRIDKADIRQWDRDRLGQYVGYLSQEADMLPGTVAQNIARFAPDASDESIVEAAKKAQVHDMILLLPEGYSTRLGPGGMGLSGGQRQRIGLARAFFGTPKILVLDEPNANLDMEGDAALDRALAQAKAAKITIVIVTQRKVSADKLDLLMVLNDGQIEDYGPREAVMEKQNAKMRDMVQKAQKAAQAQGFQPMPAQEKLQ